MKIKHLGKEYEGKTMYQANEWKMKPVGIKIIKVFTDEKNGKNHKVYVSFESGHEYTYFREYELDMELFETKEEAQIQLDKNYQEYLSLLTSPKEYIDFLMMETIIPVQQGSDMDELGIYQMSNLKAKALESSYFTLFNKTLIINDL